MIHRFTQMGRWLSGSVPPIEAGKDMLYAAARDVTVQKKSEEERQKFVSLADSSLEFIGMCDRDFKPFYVNPAGIRLVGLDSLKAACSTQVQDFFFPEDQPFISQHFFPRVLREGQGDVEIRFRNFKTGDAVWMLYHVFAIRDANGAVVSWATVSRNVHARKQAEAERRKLESQVLRAQKLESLGIMAGGIAHDFNNMLTGILGFSDLARRSLPDTSSAIPHVEEVIKEAQRAAEVTQQMLSYFGKGVFVLQPVQLTALIEDMRNMLKISVTKKCELRFDFAPGVPACEADSTQLRQIIMNTGHQRFRSHQRRRRPHHHQHRHRKAFALQPGRILHRRSAPGRLLCLPPGRRQRGRHLERNSHQTLRPLLHHQIHGPRPRPLHRPHR